MDSDLPDFTPIPDPTPNLVARSTTGRPRRSAPAYVALLALLAGAGGGFVGGRLSVDSRDANVSAVGVGSSGATGAGDTMAMQQSVTSDGAATGAIAAGGISVRSSSAVDMAKVTHLFKRDAAGASVRVSRIEFPGNSGCQGQGCPPAECFPVASINVTVVDDWDIAQGGSEIYKDAQTSDHALTIGGTIFGGGYAAPGDEMLTGVIMSVKAPVTHVRLTNASGVTLDEMDPNSGIVVLVTHVKVADQPPFQGLIAVGMRADGSEVERATADSFAMGAPPDACKSPPGTDTGGQTATTVPRKPLLPPAGQQPADPAGAEKGLRAAFASALGGNDAASLNAAVDDPEGLQTSRDASRKAYPQYADKVKFVLDELVFSSPTRASFAYHVVFTDDGSTIISHIGTARAVNGQWFITRATICDLLPEHPNGTC